MLSRISAILLLSLTLVSQGEAVLTIDITEGTEGAVSIAVVPFEWSGKTAPPVSLANIVAADLHRSGYFSPFPERDMVARPHDFKQVNFGTWRAANVDYLVAGRLQSLGDGTYQVQFQLMDVLKGTQLAGYSIRSRESDLRRTAHQMSDIIYKAITGKPGAFDTRIAYVTVTKKGKQGNVYQLAVADADGYNEQVIYESTQPLMSPDWAPDGNHVVYVSFARGRSEIYIQNIFTRKTERVADFKGLNSAPEYSPDGKRLALTLSKDGNPEVYIMDIASKRLQRITRNSAIDTEPTWMPDGKSIVFTSDRGGSPQLYQVSIGNNGASGRPRRLTFEGNYNARPTVSPDGRNIAMVHREQGKFRIALLELNTGRFRVITDSRLDESPSFAPNGSMIIYATEDNYRGVLAAVSVDGRAQQKLRLKSGDVREPSWSSFKAH